MTKVLSSSLACILGVGGQMFRYMYLSKTFWGFKLRLAFYSIPHNVVLWTGLPRLCVFFFQQITCMHYFLANCAPKIPNYAQIMQIATYFLAKN